MRWAAALGPGEAARTESDLGFHVVRRPELDEVRGEFQAAIQGVLITRMNLDLVEELEERWEIDVSEGALETMREVVAHPAADGRPRETLGTYRGGRFTVADLRRWLKALPVDYTAEARGWDDGDLTRFLRGLMRNEVLEIEAREAGYAISTEDYAMLRLKMTQDLGELRAALGLDTLLREDQPAEERERVAATAVDRYLEALTNDLALLVPVPPFLAEKLRDEMSWGVSRTAVERALMRGARLRVLMQSAGRESTSQEPDSSDGREESHEPK